MEGYIDIDSKLDAWILKDFVLRNGRKLEVFHENKWEKAVVENQTELYMYEIDEYKRIRCDVLIKV